MIGRFYRDAEGVYHYQFEEARDEHGRWASGGKAGSMDPKEAPIRFAPGTKIADHPVTIKKIYAPLGGGVGQKMKNQRWLANATDDAGRTFGIKSKDMLNTGRHHLTGTVEMHGSSSIEMKTDPKLKKAL